MRHWRGVPRTPLFTLGALALLPALALGQTNEGEGSGEGGEGHGPRPDARPTVTAGVSDADIRLDGVLDEAVWASVPRATGFVQGEPVEGVPAEEDTEVRVLFGDEAIYVAARMWDSEPGKISDRLVRRDERGTYDWIAVAFDPNLDRRTGYVFQVSAANVQRDEYLFDDQRGDDNWDAVWESAVEHDERGWTVEMRIPLSQIRYESGDRPQTWGVNFARRRVANNELSYFALKSRLREGQVSQFGRLEGVRLTGGSRRIELRPYVLSQLHDGPAEDGDPFFDGTDGGARVGADVRVGLGSAFTLDATVNPDFGQVEADPAVINLSAVETFFEERRPFFVEDAQVFDFSLSGRQNQLFYSRRIGRRPRGDAPAGADFDDLPDAATILGAAKLTGRTAGGLSVGVLAAATQGEEGRAYFTDDDRFETFLGEPAAQYGVFRLQQDFNGGASQVGGIFTGMRRDLPEDGQFDFLPAEAFSAGVRFEHQWSDRTWALSGFLAGGHVRGDSTAMTRIQRASNHYFQRPDATRLEVDSTATALTGAEWRLSLSKQNGRHWTGSAWLGEVTSAFEINDLGFSSSDEALDVGGRIGYREIRPGSVFRNYSVNFFTFHNFSHEALDDAWSADSWRGAYTRGSFNLNTRGEFTNWWGGDLNLSVNPDTYSRTATRGGPIMLDPGSVSLRGGLNTDRREAVSFRAGFNLRSGFDDSGSQMSVEGGVTFRPTPSVEVQVQPEWSRQVDKAQYVTASDDVFFAPTYGDRYLFGDLHRTSLSMETRLNVAFSPRLTLQLYAQPLISSGDYRGYKQLAASETFDFVRFEEGGRVAAGDETLCVGGQICREVQDDGDVVQHVDFDGDGIADFDFGDRDFNVRSLVGNAVLRWEYRPGSTVFLVWQRSQSFRANVGDFDLGRDVGALFGLPADNRFILKVNYWLGL